MVANERRCRPITHLTAANCEQLTGTPEVCPSSPSPSPLTACFQPRTGEHLKENSVRWSAGEALNLCHNNGVVHGQGQRTSVSLTGARRRAKVRAASEEPSSQTDPNEELTAPTTELCSPGMETVTGRCLVTELRFPSQTTAELTHLPEDWSS